MNDSTGAVTVALLVPGVLCVFGLFFCWAWFVDRERRYLRLIGIAPFVFAVAVVLRAATQTGAAPLDTLVTDLAVLSSVMILAQGILGRSSVAFGLQFALGTVVAIGAGCGALALFLPHSAAEVYVRSAGCGLILLMAAARLMQLHTHRSVDRVLNWVVALFALQFIPRSLVLVDLMESGVSPDSSGSVLWVALQLLMGLLGAALTGAMCAAYLSDVVLDLRRERDDDMLTGVLNRRGFEVKAALALKDRGSRSQVMIVGDLDHFKHINDDYGHATGDAVLRRFGVLLNESVRAGDIVGRVGGEEFAILAHDIDLVGGFNIAERLRAALTEQRLDTIDASLTVTASFGVAPVVPGDTIASLLAEADRQLYLAKRAGRNRTFGGHLSFM